jgi:Zn-dependent protease with chaperone function
MLVMVALYLLIIAGTAAFVWWYATMKTGVVWHYGGIHGLLLYLTPAVSGLVLAFFLVKPLFASAPGDRQRVRLEPDEHPVLFALVRDICGQVRAPMPVRIEVDCEPNASARLAPGVAAFLRRDLVLSLGLPVAAKLTVRQFSGVVAHELGHFAQGGGMRLARLVSGLSAWFHRVVHERDAWDERIERVEGDVRLILIVLVARGSVWVSRRILQGLMLTGHGAAAFLLRQMEFDADGREIQVVGSQTFTDTMRHMRTLDVGAHIGRLQCRDMWQRRFLPDDLPSFVVAQDAALPEDTRTAIRAGAEQGSAGFFDTHPSDHARVRAAEATARQGVFEGGEGPASALFRDFGALSAAATRHHYERRLGLDLAHVRLVDAEGLAGEGTQRDEGQRAFRDMFEGCVNPRRPLRVPVDDLRTLDESAIAACLIDARVAMSAGRGVALADAYRDYGGLLDAQHRAFAAQECLLAGVDIGPSRGFEPEECSMEGALATHARVASRRAEVTMSLTAFEGHASRRLAAAAMLAARRGDARALSVAEGLNRVAAVIPHVLTLQEHLVVAMHLRSMPGVADPPGLSARRHIVEVRAYPCLEQLKAELSGVEVPDGPSGAMVPVASWWADGDPPDISLHEVIDRIVGVYMRLLIQMCAIADRVERDDAQPAAL